jgi:predicted RNase H-like nuclease (RuvC/YqgF family)
MRYENYEERGTKICNLEEELESLRQQLAESQKQVTMLRGTVSWVKENVTYSRPMNTRLDEALASTADLDGLILCHAHPVFEKWIVSGGKKVSLYRAWEPK